MVKYKVAKTVMKGYNPNWEYFKTSKEAKKYVKSRSDYPMVIRHIYKED